MPIRRRVYRQGNSWVISIPEWALDYCHIVPGSYFELTMINGPAILLTPHIFTPVSKKPESNPNEKEKEPK